MTLRRNAALAGPRTSACALFLSTLLLATLLLALIAGTSTGQADEAKGLRQDAILLLKAFWNTTGYMMACPKYVGEHPPYLDAAEAWKQRHNVYMLRVTEVIDSTGGLANEAQAQMAQEGFDDATLKLQLRGDSGLYCFNNLAEDLNAGAFDFENQDETAPALARLMRANGS